MSRNLQNSAKYTRIYNTTFRSARFEYGGKFDINNHSIELKYYSATPYSIQMAEFHIKDKQDMQYFLNHITNQWNKWDMRYWNLY